MKRITVTVTDIYLIPDDWKVTTHSRNQLPCLHGDHQYFTPYIEWAECRVLSPSKNPSRPRLEWSTVDDDRGNWFIDQHEVSATEIREIE